MFVTIVMLLPENVFNSGRMHTLNWELITMDNVRKAADILREAKNVVILTGAGASTESGIPDFRSSNGLYGKLDQFDFPAEVILSRSFFVRNTDIFYDYYFNHLVYRDAKPNDCHKALAEMEKLCPVKAIVTQNIDGLHQQAGSTRVIELHGTVSRYYCMSCFKKFALEDIEPIGVPKCRHCGGLIKPDVVLYEEPLNEKDLTDAMKLTAAADALLVIGTSLAVYPAAGLLNYYRGHKLIIVNKSPTPYDDRANVLIRDNAGKTMKAIVSLIKEGLPVG